MLPASTAGLVAVGPARLVVGHEILDGDMLCDGEAPYRDGPDLAGQVPLPVGPPHGLQVATGEVGPRSKPAVIAPGLEARKAG
jgi:hypothetical protein